MNMHLMTSLLLCMLNYGHLFAQDNKAQDTKTRGTLTVLGTIKGEIDRVIDGGNKIEVKYKELVASAIRTNSSNTTRSGASSAKFRPPLPKDFYLKEKTNELELRVPDFAVIRVLETSDLPASGTAAVKKQNDKTVEKKDAQNEKESKTEKQDEKQIDETKDKVKGNSAVKSGKKSTEPKLPGKPGDRGSLLKGQIIIVTVIREDLPGFSRLLASSIYILGEK